MSADAHICSAPSFLLVEAAQWRLKASSSSLACSLRWSSPPGRMLRCFTWWVIRVCVICDSGNLAQGNIKKKYNFSTFRVSTCSAQMFCCCDITEVKPFMCNSMQSSFQMPPGHMRGIYIIHSHSPPEEEKRVIHSGKVSVRQV